MKTTSRTSIMFLVVLVASLGLGCNLSSRMAPPTPTPTIAPTETPVPTNTPLPTPTTAPTATFTPMATLAEQATAAPTATMLVRATVPAEYVVNQVLRFGAGPFKQALSGSVVKGTNDRYEVAMVAGETLDIRLTSPQETAGFMVLGPDQQPMRGSENGEARWWSSGVTQNGTYAIIVGSELGRSAYTLSVNVGPTTGAGAGAYKALSAAECKELRSQAQSALGVAFTASEGGFSAQAGVGGTACVLSANGTGRDFGSVEDVFSKLEGGMGGWSFDNAFSADGPTGSVRGYRSGDNVMIISVQWRPAPDADCPADQPIANCELKPKQKLFAVVIQAAQK